MRNVIERIFCRLKDFRAIATRYDKTAQNLLAGLCLVTALCYWVNLVQTLVVVILLQWLLRVVCGGGLGDGSQIGRRRHNRSW